MLSAIFSALGGNLVDVVLGKVMGIFDAYFKKEISMEELRTKLHQAMLESFAEVEKSHADALAKTYSAFMQTLAQSQLMQRAWVLVVMTQLFVLFWYQWVVPFLVTYGFVTKYAGAGATIEWAYLLLAGCLGMGPVILRNGPGAGDLAGKLKSLVSK